MPQKADCLNLAEVWSGDKQLEISQMLLQCALCRFLTYQREQFRGVWGKPLSQSPVSGAILLLQLIVMMEALDYRVAHQIC